MPSKPPQPTVDLIRRRLRVTIDGRPGATARALTTVNVGGQDRERRLLYSGRRAQCINMALRWRALGCSDVQIRIGPTRPFKTFPASQQEAIAAVHELAADPSPFAAQWRRFTNRLDEPRPAGENRCPPPHPPLTRSARPSRRTSPS